MNPGFQIAFTENHWIDEGTPFRGVRLALQDWIEEENADLTYWSTNDYESQWMAELNYIVASRDKGALITSIHNPIHASRVSTWTMWKERDQILFQNRLLFMLEEEHSFDPIDVYQYIGEYKSHSEDGQRLSEWTVPLSSISHFISERPFA